MKKLIAFLYSKTFFANVVLGILFFITLFFVVNLWLESNTNHGEAVEVPALTGYTLAEAESVLQDVQLTYQVIDSAEFNPKIPLGGVVDQFPEAGNRVKVDRVILLTINPNVERKIAVPNMLEKTLRRAVYDLESKGFVVGQLTYTPDIAKDVVLHIEVEGNEINPGDKFVKGTVIDLIVGAGLGDERVSVPYLKFLTADDAETKIKKYSLNLGIKVFDEEVTDSASALVYRQSPEATHKPYMRMGANIDIWLTNDSTKIVNDSLAFKYHGLDTDSIKAYLETDSTKLGD